MTTHQRILLVDISWLFRRFWHTTPESAERNTAAQQVLDRLTTLENEAHVICCLDAPPYKRKELFPEYKGQRAEPSEELTAAKRWLLGQLKARGYPIARAKGYEADDVMATLAELLIDGEHCEDVWLYGPDKDMWQCLGPGVYQYCPGDKNKPDECRSEMWLREMKGLLPEQVVDYLALVGDASDNVPGCPGVGEKTALKLLGQYKNLDGIYAAAHADPSQFCKDTGSQRLCTRLLENEEQVRLARRLVTLFRNVPLDVTALLERNPPAPIEVHDELPPSEPTHAAPAAAEEPPTVEAEPVDPRAEAAPQSSVVVAANDVGRSTALAATPPSWEHGLEPYDNRQLAWMAQRLAESGLYPRLTWQGIYAIALLGRSLGLGVAQSLQNFSIVEGAPRPGWQLIVAMATQHPDCEYLMCTESTREQSTWETKRRQNPRPQTLTYTFQDAVDAGLVRPRGPWEKYRQNMLRKMAAVHLCRMVYPDSKASGLYVPEEFASSAMSEAA